MDEKPIAVQPPPPAPPKKLSADELVKKHLEEVSRLKPDQHPDSHLLLSEHAANLERWQMRALLARFHAHGLHVHSRIHPDVYKAALSEALHGRV